MTNFIVEGHGSPVILIHGLAASLFDWVSLVPELTERKYQAYALDLFGHGGSERSDNPSEYTVKHVMDHFLLWMNSIQLHEKPVIIGHSLGGLIALQYAITNPEKIKGLVLCDPFYSLQQLPFLLRNNVTGSLISNNLISKTPEWMIKGVLDFASLTIRNGFLLSNEARVQTAQDYKRAHPAIFNIIHTVAMDEHNLSMVTKPVLVIWGQKDRTLNPESFYRLVQLFPKAQSAVIENAGHVPHQSHSEQFNQLVLQFLYSIDNSDSRN